MSWKLVVLTGFVIVGGAIIVASWKPWSSSAGVHDFDSCVHKQETSKELGPALAKKVCRALGWTP